AQVKADLARRGTTIAADVSLPAAVSLFRFRQDSGLLKGTITADSANLEIVKALVPDLKDARVAGRLAAKVDLGGTWSAPVLTGGLAIADGRVFVPALGATFSAINGSVQATRRADGDSISVCVTAASDTRQTSRTAERDDRCSATSLPPGRVAV